MSKFACICNNFAFISNLNLLNTGWLLKAISSSKAPFIFEHYSTKTNHTAILQSGCLKCKLCLTWDVYDEDTIQDGFFKKKMYTLNINIIPFNSLQKKYGLKKSDHPVPYSFVFTFTN